MDTTRLTALVVAAEHGSLSLAARQLGARLSTISRHISDLEAEIGEPLLVRTGRGVRPTPAGEQFIERARDILRQIESALAEARGDRHHAITYLRISAPNEMALSLLPSCIAAFYAKHPDVRLDLHSDSRRISLLEEDFDAAIRLGRIDSSELIAKPLGQVQLVVCAAPQFVPARRSFAELAKRPFVGVAGTREQLTGQVRGKRVSLRLQPHIRVSTFSEAAEIATATHLAVVLPSYVAERYLRAGTLAVVVADLMLPAIDVHLLFPQRHRQTTAIKDLAGYIAGKLSRVAPRR